MLTKDLFISYGRRESLGLVGRLHQQLKLAGYEAWFDKVNIPDGEDYAQRINQGIETAHNFVYVMAPRGLTSPYCLLELEYARILGKRVIPLNQMVIFQTDSQELAATDQAILHGFYTLHGGFDPNINTTQAVLDRSLALIGRTDWLDAKEHLSDEDCVELATWAQGYENHWHKHEDIEYLNTFEFPVFGHNTDSLASIVERMQLVLERHKPYVQKHTEILLATLTWQRHQRLTHHLLVGKERSQAEDWLLTEFLEGEQQPCQPTDLQCEFICESRKNSFNLMTHAFICYDVADKAIRDEVVRQLARQAITTWRHDQDIPEGTDFARAIEVGIETADNFLYFLSPASIQSSYCQLELEHALRYHKRIIPLLIAPTPTLDVPPPLRTLQYLDFTHGIQIDPLLKILRQDQAYYEQHKILLARALKWQQTNYQPTFLLRGHNLGNALLWLRLHQDRLEYPPTEHHRTLITASEAAKGQLGTEVFISYSRKNSDFARQLNLALQEAGKTTWFDQESISSGVDFEREIFKGIEGADNFVFIISPDSVESPYCEREVNYASTQCKRFIPLLWRPTVPDTLPKALRTINWIDFQSTPFEKAFLELIQTLDLDREHAHQHTVWQQRASDWVENNRSKDFLLNVTACQNAERWQAAALAGNKQPVPTSLQREFIQVSRQAIEMAEQQEHRRRNVILASVIGGLVIAIILAGWALNERDKATKQAKNALVEKLKAQSVVATQLPSPSNGSYEQAVLLAIQVFKEVDSELSRGNLLRVLQAKKQKRVFLYGHTSSVENVAFSPDGQILASASGDNTIRLWNVTQKQPLGEPLLGHLGSIKSIAFSPDGRTLASGSWDKTVRLWNIATGKPLGEPLAGHFEPVSSIAFSPDGQILASGSWDQSVRLWDVASQKMLGKRLTGHSNKVTSVAFSPDGKILASGSWDHTIKLWNVANRKPLGKPLIGHSGTVASVAFSPDGRTLVSGSSDNTVRLWDVVSQQPLSEPLTGHSDSVRSVAFSPDGQTIASASSDDTVRLWDVASQQPLGEPLVGHTSTVKSVAFSPDNQTLASGSNDNTVRLWNVASQRPLSEPLTGRSGTVLRVAFSTDGQILASGSSDNTVRLWNVASQQPLSEPLTGHSDSISSIVFSPDGQTLASGSSDNTVRLWDIANQKVLGWPLTGHSATVRSVAFSPDGQTLASGGDDNTVRLWNVATQQLLGEPLVSHFNSVKQVAFSPDGQILASRYSDNTVRLWDIATRQPLELPLTGYSDRVGNVAFTPNDPTLASARSWYDIMKLLGTSKPQQGQFFGEIDQLGLVSSVAFSPDGQTIASGSWDNTVIFWDTNPESWLEQLCAVANRNLSQTEWHQYMGERFHEKTCPDLPEDTLGALQSIQQGKELAREGKIKAAVKKFQLAQTLDARFVTFDLQAQAQHFAALGLVEQGKKLAQEGQVKSAIAKIKAAQALDSSLNFVPETKVREFVARGLVRQGEDLAGKGKIEAAIAKYQAAQQLDMKVNITAGQWDDLCWYGSVYGQAANVLKFCEQAVVLVPYDGNIRDSLALAKALIGDIQGAIADFQFAIDKLDDKELKKQRQSWVNALKQGENPFTKEVLKELR